MEGIFHTLNEIIDSKFATINDLKIETSIIEEKKDYIRSLYNMHSNTEYTKLIEILRNKIKYRKQLEFVKSELDIIVKIYRDAITHHKQEISKKIRIPLLIYTGKILQDHQNGLGVFITSDDELRFIPSGNTQIDILNTFSSGQLSAFVLSFLFVMNSIYSSRFDMLNFLLIDDPVQTMDDINIASFVEMMRNNHGSKQIILSTHETEKENYILYKYLKHGLGIQSFNVKDELYKFDMKGNI